MNTFWSYFWPIAAAALVIAAIGGLIAFRRKKTMPLVIAAALSLAWLGLWTGPLGAADRFTRVIERQAREALVHYEEPQMQAHLHRGPLSRRLISRLPSASRRSPSPSRAGVARMIGTGALIAAVT